MLYDVTVPQFTKMLQNLSRFFDKAVAHADAKRFDVSILLESRLAPDQYSLTRQVQTACDTAKLATARLTGKQAPSHPDTEKTLDELRARIQSTIAWLGSLRPEDFEGAEERRVTRPHWQGKSLSGTEYAIQHAIPNFYFHVTTAYAILRHNGVDLGKMDFLGPLPFRN